MKCVKIRRFMASLCAFILLPSLELSEHTLLCRREAEECHFRNHIGNNSIFLERSTLLAHIGQLTSLYFHSYGVFPKKVEL